VGELSSDWDSTSREMPLRQQRCQKGMRGSPRVACFPALPGSGAGNGVVRTAMPVLLCTPPHRALQDDGAVTRRATGWSRCGAARRRWRNVREATCGYECRGENGITRNVGLSGRRDARDKKATTDARVSSVANWRCVPHKIVGCRVVAVASDEDRITHSVYHSDPPQFEFKSIVLLVREHVGASTLQPLVRDAGCEVLYVIRTPKSPKRSKPLRRKALSNGS